ncbi:MAG: sulfatase-like hydrolase/transferase [Lachnospiraceae bacterium]|nr:sulfatase-like hydrolase/transferase [Lachnospiraceae bacterium]
MKNKNNTLLKTLSTSAMLLAVCIFLILAFAVRWVLTVWANLDMDELVYHLKAPIEGTGGGMIKQGVLNIALPVLIIMAILSFLTIRFKGHSKGKYIPVISFCISLVLFLVAGVYAWIRLDIGTYIRSNLTASTFIEENYVSPDSVDLSFPEKKRNLIYIFLESMETTYSDKANGGAYDSNYIKELTEIAQENEDFSGSDPLLNGGYVMPATTFTMGGMFAQTSGLPLKLNIAANMVDNEGAFNHLDAQESMFPSISVLGDILKEQNYNQVLLIGSEGKFGGRTLYFTSHGNYEIRDYTYAVKNSLIPADYYVFWGYEDKILFENARQTLIELSSKDEPFNLTLLTVDTHFEDGYVCDLCNDEFGDDQYANVIACSSRQVSDFISWVKKQDFYENTTIVLNGDHTTMDSDFCENIDPSYGRRTYTAYINSAVQPEDPDKTRVYTTLDNFPTTLASMGVKIEGNRLGLGTNLFSTEETFAEKIGVDGFAKELSLKSRFMEEISAIDVQKADKSKNKANAKLFIKNLNMEDHSIIFNLREIKGLQEKITGAHIIWTSPDGNQTRIDLDTVSDEKEYEKTFNYGDKDIENLKLDVYVTNVFGGDIPIASLSGNILMNYMPEYMKYLNHLKEDDRYVILMAAKEGVSGGVSGEVFEEMAKLGLKSDFSDANHKSYYAYINGDTVTEELSDSVLDYRTSLPDGSKLKLISGGSDSGSEVCISIDNTAYDKNQVGLNIVIYDTETHKVTDSVVFSRNDMYAQRPESRLP